MSVDRQRRIASMAGMSSGLSRTASRLVVVATPTGLSAVPEAGSALADPATGPVGLPNALPTVSKGWAEAVVQGSRDIVLVVAPDTSVRIANAAARRVLGLNPAMLNGVPVIDLVHPEDAERMLNWLDRVDQSAPSFDIEVRCRHADGGWVEVEASATAMLDVSAVNGTVITLRDISERKMLEAELNHWAFHDPLTNLANRVQLRERVSNALDRSARNGTAVGVLLIDLDDFKQVNDSLGHREGDRLLVAVAERLVRASLPGETVARLSGDEFVVLIDNLGDDQAAVERAEAILALLDEPVILLGEPITVCASIGIRISLGDGDGCDAEQILRDADLAMYAAKAAAKGGWQRFRPEMHELARRQLTIRTELRRAVLQQEFAMRYQPIVLLDNGQIAGFEALIRWRHPQRGLTSPDQFIGEAEASGLIIPIGAWVLQQACLAAAELRRVSGRDLTMSVNVSPRQLMSDDIVEVVRCALRDAGLPESALCLEITESVLADDVGLLDRLKSLRSLGVHLAIDDFGTGFSSYAHLQRLPIDTIKIDRSFIEPLSADEASPALARSIIPMCLSLGLRTVAEGVETVEQLHELRQLGCLLAQGYLFDRPLEFVDALDLVERGSDLILEEVADHGPDR